MISAFGPQALRYASGLGDLHAVVTEIDFMGDAYLEAVRRRERGEPFYGMVLLDDPRIALGYRIANEILTQVADYDRRRLIASDLAGGTLPVNGARIDSFWRLDPLQENIATEFLALADAVLVRSFAEGARVHEWFRRTYPRRAAPPVTRILADARVPEVERGRPDRPGVIVWAPHRPALETALHLHALAEVHGDLTCVTAGGPLPSRSNATFCAPGEGAVATALSRASAIVCVDPSDPSEAVAFARQGFGIVAPVTSGAHEFAANVVTWDALDAHSLYTAVAVAVTRPAGVRSEPARPPRAPLPPPRPPFIRENELPLVSIVTPTYNRRDDLSRMLSCLAAQTYPRIEAVVVNDGGVPVDDIVAAFPFARLIDRPVNAGALRALEVGRAAARGEYIGVLPDDDWLYPDHVDRLMNAIFRSGAAVAHGAALLRFVERDAAGLVTVGFNNRTFSETLTPTAALVSATVGGHQMLVHRSAYDQVGGYLLDSEVSDGEMHIRLTQRYFYAFADHVTAEFRDHAGGAGRRVDFPAALRAIYESVHPVPNRPEIARKREATLRKVALREPGMPPFPISIRFGNPPASP